MQNPCSWLFKSQATASFDIIKLAKDSDWSVWRGVIEPKHSLSIECTQCEDRSACNYNGQCLESKCICNEGYFGELCQFERPCYQIRCECSIDFLTQASLSSFAYRSNLNHLLLERFATQPKRISTLRSNCFLIMMRLMKITTFLCRMGGQYMWLVT